MEKSKEYSNGEVTVVWKPTLCIHSANCVNGLPDVFKPKEKPWIQVENSNTAAIIKTVNACPSGALSHYLNAEGKPEKDKNRMIENTKIEVVENGPLLVHGAINVNHSDGKVEEKSRTTAFCRCSKSGNQPFCDGSHNR